jgi:hypothetical protein
MTWLPEEASTVAGEKSKSATSGGVVSSIACPVAAHVMMSTTAIDPITTRANAIGSASQPEIWKSLYDKDVSSKVLGNLLEDP